VCEEIIKVLPQCLGDEALKLTRDIMRQAVFEYYLSDLPIDPLWSMLGEIHGLTPTGKSTDWERTFKLARALSALSQTPAPAFSALPEDKLRTVAKSASRLRQLGGIVVAREGNIDVLNEDVLCETLLGKIQSIGPRIFTQKLLGQLDLNSTLKRYRLVRNLRPGRPPTVPVGFLLHLAMRRFSAAPPVDGPHDIEDIRSKFANILEIATCLMSTRDYEEYSFGERLLFGSYSGMLDLFHRIIAYDMNFHFGQMSPTHAVELLPGIFSEFTADECRAAWGGKVSDAVDCINQLFHAQPSLGREISAPLPSPTTTPICSEIIDRLLNGEMVNEEFVRPGAPVNGDSRPLFRTVDGGLMLPDAHWRAPLILDALMKSLKDAGALNVDKRIGLGLETALAGALRARGILCFSGKYYSEAFKRKLEADCIILCGDTVLLIEVKKKSLTAPARRQNDRRLVSDLAHGLLKSQWQACRHEVEFRSQGVIRFESGATVRVPKEAKYLRITLTLGDYGCLHDSIIAVQFLDAVRTCSFGGPPGAYANDWKEFAKLQNRFKEATGRLGDLGVQDADLVHYTSFVNFAQFLTVLDDAGSAEGLVEAFRSVGAVSTGSGDFVFEYWNRKTLYRK